MKTQEELDYEEDCRNAEEIQVPALAWVAVFIVAVPALAVIAMVIYGIYNLMK